MKRPRKYKHINYNRVTSTRELARFSVSTGDTYTLDYLVNAYGIDAVIEMEWDYEGYDMVIKTSSVESDTEYANRIRNAEAHADAAENAKKEQRKRRLDEERKEYERLKKKFEGV